MIDNVFTMLLHNLFSHNSNDFVFHNDEIKVCNHWKMTMEGANKVDAPIIKYLYFLHVLERQFLSSRDVLGSLAFVITLSMVMCVFKECRPL